MFHVEHECESFAPVGNWSRTRPRLGVANYSLIKLIRKCPTVTICLNIIVPRGTFGFLRITESMVTVNLTYNCYR